MDCQRTTYCPRAMALLMATSYEEFATIVDCALGIYNPATRRCVEFADIADAIAPLVPVPAAALYDYIKVSDVKAPNTDGGAFNNGAWRTRDINTEDVDTGGHCAIAANQITLQPGTYNTLIRCPAFEVDEHKSRLRDITNAATVLLGSSKFAAAAADGENDSIIQGRFSILSATVLEVQHRCITSRALAGFGVGSLIGVNEVYTVAEFWREPD